MITDGTADQIKTLTDRVAQLEKILNLQSVINMKSIEGFQDVYNRLAMLEGIEEGSQSKIIVPSKLLKMVN